MQVVQTSVFRRAVKRLHASQKNELDSAVRAIMGNPEIGTAKIGDLSGIRVHKFKLTKQIALLAYSYSDTTITLTLLALGSHENFYRDLKRTSL